MRATPARFWNLILGTSLFVAFAGSFAAEPLSVVIDTEHPGPAINPAMGGIFFEDINFGADGGLYAELVKNRGFEFPDPLMGWAKLPTNDSTGKMEVLDKAPCNDAGPHYLRLSSETEPEFGVENEGFRGMGIQADELLTRVSGAGDEGTNQAPRLFASGTREDKSGEVILKLVNPTAQGQTANIVLEGTFMPRKEAKATLVAGSSPHDENSFAAPARVTPRVSTLGGVSRSFNYECPPESITVLRMGSL